MPDVQDVAVLYDIVFSFYGQFSGFFTFLFGAERCQVVVFNHFGANKAAFQAAVYDAGGLWGCHSFSDCPCAVLFASDGKERDEI